MTYAIYSNLIDFYEKYRDSDFAILFEDELKNSETDLDRLYQVVSAICQRSQNEIYKRRTDKFKYEFERDLERAKDDYEEENKRYWEYNKKYDSIIRDYNDPENEVYKRYRSDYDKAHEQKRHAEVYWEKCDTAISNIFLLCTKTKELLLPYCPKEELSKTNSITINNAHYSNISSEQRINQQITNIHTEQTFNQHIDNSVKNFDIDNSVTNNCNNNTSGNNASNDPVDVSKNAQNINEKHQYFTMEYAMHIYPLICKKGIKINSVPNNILDCTGDEFYNLLNLRITEDYTKFINNTSKSIILAFIRVLSEFTSKKEVREEWTERIYCKFYGKEEPGKIHDYIRKHRNTTFEEDLRTALGKV